MRLTVTTMLPVFALLIFLTLLYFSIALGTSYIHAVLNYFMYCLSPSAIVYAP